MIKTKEISQYILNIENNYPVNEWVINNEIIWPFIRIKLFTDLNFANNKTFVRKSQSFKTTDNNKLKKLFKSVFSYNRLKQKDYFFTSTYAHRAKYNNKYWNKFYDPLVEDATISSYSIVEHNTKGYYSKKEEVNNYKQLFFFEDFHYSTDVISSKIKKLIPIIKDVNLPQYAHFYKQLKNDNLLNNRLENYELKNIIKQFERLFLMVKTYKKILKKIKPKIVFEVCYYSMNSMALNLASKSLNIPSVEFQHGPQPPLHMAYGNWGIIENKSYSLFPSIFWQWDEESNKTIKPWIQSNEMHSFIVNGNPWLSYFNNKSELIKGNIILYSLQPFSNDILFPKYLVESIKTGTHKWVLRVHPTDFNRINEIESFLIANDLAKYVLLSGKDQPPLPVELAQSFLHITNYSGTAIEAAEYGIKTIFIHPMANEYFKELIDSNMAYYSDGNNFDELINKSEKTNLLDKKQNKTPKQMFDDLLKLLNIQ